MIWYLWRISWQHRQKLLAALLSIGILRNHFWAPRKKKQDRRGWRSKILPAIASHFAFKKLWFISLGVCNSRCSHCLFFAQWSFESWCSYLLLQLHQTAAGAGPVAMAYVASSLSLNSELLNKMRQLCNSGICFHVASYSLIMNMNALFPHPPRLWVTFV